MKDTLFYKIVKPLVIFFIKVFYHPKVLGLENIPKDGRVVLAGNHTKWLDPIMLIAYNKRQIHFLAKDELFHGVTKFIVKGMGSIPVNRKIHDKDALIKAIESLNNDLCVGIFPEGTINRTNDIIMPFKIGAVKMAFETDSRIIPFIITGKYRIIGKSVTLEFLKPIKIGKDLDKSNDKLMHNISKKIKENRK
ncbi:MAG: 1-acyl-sn-glycerol-3-phosphate acyltransferase [Bacilli bacterium]|nr:1-acyl-sn-glycerol-3-phosphate acyltransferase [Bacilli bacterium]